MAAPMRRRTETAGRPRSAAARAQGRRRRRRRRPGRSCAASTRRAAVRPRAARPRPACRRSPSCPPAAPATSSVLRSAEVRWKSWANERAERAARHDDRPFGAERAAGADGDGRRERLEQRDLGLDPALADEDASMPRGCRGRGFSPSRSGPSVRRSGRRPPARRLSTAAASRMPWRNATLMGGQAPKLDEIGDKRDQLQQRPRRRRPRRCPTTTAIARTSNNSRRSAVKSRSASGRSAAF